MIASFKDSNTKTIFDGESLRGLDKQLLKKARRRLELLNAAVKIEDLYFPPSNQFHKLGGNQSGRYAVRVDERWRVTFEWANGNAYEVCFEDYHK
ncbi:MAG: plasmid encoded proteic killer toxin HigB [uncultured bacterium]|nr:MAG: plasmid encoded proteic killer toxin HigB [uncultured bacterium]